MATSGDSALFGILPGGLSATTENAIKLHMNEIASLRIPSHNDGNVLAVVTFPRDDLSARACDGEPWHDIHLRMSSEKLLKLGSKVISDMLTSKAQARFRRRLGFKELPDGIEYILDFTPPEEGIELADLTTALWLPRVVKLWFLAGLFMPAEALSSVPCLPHRPLADKAVGAVLALGHDDVCRAGTCLTLLGDWEPRPDRKVPGIVDDNPSEGVHHIPSWRKVDDYCPIRHRVAIARVLRAINGDDLLLNSAVRMWTVAQVAISLEVPQVVVDPVTQWLIAPPNTKFIEICPERAFQLAHALKIPSVLIAAFGILVSEHAIDYASPNPIPGSRRPLTWVQRRRDELADYLSTPIEYASRAMVERLNAKFNLLMSDDVFDLLPLNNREWKKLKYYEPLIAELPTNHPLVKAYTELVSALRTSFRRWINKALKLDSLDNPNNIGLRGLIEAQRRHYVPAAESMQLSDLYDALASSQKILTPFFWNILLYGEPEHAFAENFSGGQFLSWFVTDFNSALQRAVEEEPTPAFVRTPLKARVSDAIGNGPDTDIDFFLGDFFHALRHGVCVFCHQVMGKPLWGYATDSDSGIPLFLSDHLLLPLSEQELNYLPIWAGGLDDGSGGVFQEVIPPAEMGPSEPGPAYHTGFTAASTDADEAMTDAGTVATTRAAPAAVSVSNLDIDALSIGTSTDNNNTNNDVMSMTTGRSLVAQPSGPATLTAGTTGSRSVVASTFGDDESVYAAARFEQPAEHQVQGQAIAQYVDEVGGDGDDFMWEDDGEAGFDFDEDDNDEEVEDDGSDGSSTLDGFEEVDGRDSRG
ncbi:hypothetical protein VTJ49DRAFT_199 [Mycothermus thermophilus]|uniref:Uncharacterized protein n=1 Tax=Humicola insolens TaxID=85995 RepID=A0ABR3VFT1_HUMIN